MGIQGSLPFLILMVFKVPVPHFVNQPGATWQQLTLLSQMVTFQPGRKGLYEIICYYFPYSHDYGHI